MPDVTLTDEQLARLDVAARSLLVDAIAAVPDGIAHERRRGDGC